MKIDFTFKMMVKERCSLNIKVHVEWQSYQSLLKKFTASLNNSSASLQIFESSFEPFASFKRKRAMTVIYFWHSHFVDCISVKVIFSVTYTRAYSYTHTLSIPFTRLQREKQRHTLTHSETQTLDATLVFFMWMSFHFR